MTRGLEGVDAVLEEGAANLEELKVIWGDPDESLDFDGFCARLSLPMAPQTFHIVPLYTLWQNVWFACFLFFEWFGRQLVQWCPETLCFLAVIMWLPFQRRPSCSDTQQTCFSGCIVMSCLHWRSILPRYSHFSDLFSCFQFKQSHRMTKSLATCDGHCHFCFWFCHM